jgi:hypothetical protein
MYLQFLTPFNVGKCVPRNENADWIRIMWGQFSTAVTGMCH